MAEINKMDDGYQAAIDRDKKAFFDKYPDVKRSQNIKVLDLVMKREFAEAILRGEKTVEYRTCSQFYCDRLYDKTLMAMGDSIADRDMDDFVDFARPLREVESIHFHNYNNTWFLDVSITDNWTVTVCDEGVEEMHDFESYELDELNKELNATGASERPIYFYFAIGKVLATDLR